MPDSANTSSDFRPTANWQRLRFRAELLHRLRGFFHKHGFLEVETPVLSADTVVDRHLDPFAVVQRAQMTAPIVKPDPAYTVRGRYGLLVDPFQRIKNSRIENPGQVHDSPLFEDMRIRR